MIPLAFLAIYAGGMWFQGVLMLGAAIMAWEWQHLCWGRFEPAGVLLAIGGIGAAALGGSHPVWVWILLFFILVCCSGFWLTRHRDKVVWSIVGACYVTVPILALAWLRLGSDNGLGLTLWLFVAVWATDTGAYVCGRMIGGPRMIPKVSPNKTWAGAIGGVVWAMMVGGLYAVWSAHSVAGLVACSIVLSVIAQGGDLWESWVKRRFGAKDSGALIPGHGGLLDRVDGLLSAALFVAILCVLREEDVLLW